MNLSKSAAQKEQKMTTVSLPLSALGYVHFSAYDKMCNHPFPMERAAVSSSAEKLILF
jgi:hypothetical protein